MESVSKERVHLKTQTGAALKGALFRNAYRKDTKERYMKPLWKVMLAVLPVLFIGFLFVVNIPEQEEEDRIYGITVDDCWYGETGIEDIVGAIRDMPVKPMVRIVMSKEIDAADYAELFSRIHGVAYVMACPVDSYDMHAYEDEESYVERFRDAYSVLARYTDLWEIGNEINGVEWIRQDPELIVQKAAAANRFIRAQGGSTALTLYYPGEEDSQSLFPWIGEYLTGELIENVDFALLSYYEDDHEEDPPDWSGVFPALEKSFPNAKVGFGECGNTAESATDKSKIRMAKAYYSMKKLSGNYIGGYFWWNWVQDCVPHDGNPVYEKMNRAMTADF